MKAIERYVSARNALARHIESGEGQYDDLAADLYAAIDAGLAQDSHGLAGLKEYARFAELVAHDDIASASLMRVAVLKMASAITAL